MHSLLQDWVRGKRLICAGVMLYYVEHCINRLHSPLLILVSNLANWMALFNLSMFYLSLWESGEYLQAVACCEAKYMVISIVNCAV